ncbi:MAG TPA: lipoprotein-releasing ABC transporter permease subunit [Rhizomicrobium sp.]|jgi:lipoprotein-releasing system permease protein|nr:lipoprotein-releasing ABC transporter permease subunit [Rhizomicrobium sp.]
MSDSRTNFGKRGADAGVASATADAPAKSTRAFAPFEWMIAARYLRAKRRESFISVISVISLIGIMLGVATLIIVMAVMNGFRVELLSKILGFTGHMTVQADSYNGLTGFDAIAARVRQVPGVLNVYPIVEGQALATSGGASLGADVRGVRRSDLNAMPTLSRSLAPQALALFQGGDAVIVGTGVARRLGLLPGMQITLTAPRGNITPFGTTPRVKSYTVAGTFDAGASEYNNAVIFMPLEEAQLYFNLPRAASSLEITIADPDRANTMVDAVQKAAGFSARVHTWQDLNLSLFDAVKVERNVMFLILTLIMLVAALNIISGLIMLVKDKSGDIAILRTMGATRGAVMRVFLIAGASIGIFGTIAGVILGVVFCIYIDPIQQGLSALFHTQLFNPDIYFLTHMPAKMDPDDVITVVCVSLSLSLLATLYPSWRAARLDPVEALRYE